MFTLTDSNKRALRTAYHGLVSLITLLPLLATWLHGTPVEGQLTLLVGWTSVVSKVLNTLEEKGLIPAFLRDLPAPADTVDPVASAAADAVEDHPAEAGSNVTVLAPAAAEPVEPAAAADDTEDAADEGTDPTV